MHDCETSDKAVTRRVAPHRINTDTEDQPGHRGASSSSTVDVG